MNARKEKFQSYKTHPWLKRVYTRLSVFELGVALSFLEENAALDKGSFELAVNRLFLNTPAGERPKNWAAVCELLTCANSST